jgi:Protein of unknown function (DUF2911)
MKPSTCLIIALGFLTFACNTAVKSTTSSSIEHANHGSTAPSGGSKLSPRREAMADIGPAHVHIEYGSPSVRGRVIWGGLVAMDQVWATGAHHATSIDFSEDVEINGKKVLKGKYGFFTIPGKEEWVLIISKNWDQHLADEYDPKDDVVRIAAKPQMLNEVVESLTYEVIPGEKRQGRVEISWEKVKVGFGFKVR